MTLPNDYQGVQRALTVGRWLESGSDLSKKFTTLAQSMFEQKPGAVPLDSKKRFLEFFSVAHSPSTAIVPVKKSVG